ncbi:uncharacterized protein LOC132299255 [Cornus florida]|uniref:uncharacterized protein LOC132299255 n=1 Tax=Cornus florida TaxID=4283 RepID=UPI00289E03F3|nr:uncharacterized protein LOC132299255 [Cornus florida]
MAASSSPLATIPTNSDLIKEIKSHEVAIAELSNISSSRAVYQKNGNIFFRTTVPKATAFEQRELDTAKAKLQKLNSP